LSRQNLIHNEQPGTVTGVIRAKDVDYFHKLADDTWSGDALLYSHLSGEATYVPKDASLPITLKAREYDVFTIVPAKTLSSGATFSPIGLLKMFNSGGAIKDVKYETEKSGHVSMRVRGCGVFGAYSSVRPKRVIVGDEETEFEYEEELGFLKIELSVPEQEMYLWDVIIEV